VRIESEPVKQGLNVQEILSMLAFCLVCFHTVQQDSIEGYQVAKSQKTIASFCASGLMPAFIADIKKTEE
jgi:hypothetical protein